MKARGETANLKDSLTEVVKVIRRHDSFVLLEHQKPDGDCVGSGLALVQALRALGKQALLVSDDPHPAVYDFLPGRRFYTRVGYLKPEDFRPEVAIFLDCTDPERAGRGLEFAKDKFWVNIDHHVSNSYFGSVNLVDPEAAATGELVYDIINALEVPVDKDISTCLYVAIVTDTGGFRYQNTTKETHILAAELLDKGVNGSEIFDSVFETRTVSSIMLLARALSTLKLYRGGKIAVVSLTQEMIRASGASSDETEGIIGYPRSISGVEVSLFFKEADEPGKVHVSFRSRSAVDVAAVAQTLGGGGHPRAAGALIEGTIEEVTAKVMSQLDQLDIWTGF
jgi:phosphoesterase RecJ-like protein